MRGEPVEERVGAPVAAGDRAPRRRLRLPVEEQDAVAARLVGDRDLLRRREELPDPAVVGVVDRLVAAGLALEGGQRRRARSRCARRARRPRGRRRWAPACARCGSAEPATAGSADRRRRGGRGEPGRPTGRGAGDGRAGAPTRVAAASAAGPRRGAAGRRLTEAAARRGENGGRHRVPATAEPTPAPQGRPICSTPPVHAQASVVTTERTKAVGTAARWTSRKRRGRRLTISQYCDLNPFCLIPDARNPSSGETRLDPIERGCETVP